LEYAEIRSLYVREVAMQWPNWSRTSRDHTWMLHSRQEHNVNINP